MVDLPAPIEGGSGSGLEAIEQMMLLFEFPPTEDVGQLYSYRLNSRAAVLGTRRWQPFGGQNVTIGVQQTGSGMYMCLAANANERSMQTVTIRVQGTDIDCRSLHNKINSPRILIGAWKLSHNFFISATNPPETTAYLRFSTTTVDQALQLLQLQSKEFMTSVFTTTILNVLGTNLGTQQAANCYQVPRYAAHLYGGWHIVIWKILNYVIKEMQIKGFGVCSLINTK